METDHIAERAETLSPQETLQLVLTAHAKAGEPA